jgi:hypothetical protein
VVFYLTPKTHRKCAADCKRYACDRRTPKARTRCWGRRRGRKKCGAQRGANGCEDENLQFHGIYWMSLVFPDAVGSALAKDPLRVSEDPPGRGLGDNARRRFSRRIDDFYYFLSIPWSNRRLGPPLSPIGLKVAPRDKMEGPRRRLIRRNAQKVIKVINPLSKSTRSTERPTTNWKNNWKNVNFVGGFESTNKCFHFFLSYLFLNII